MGRGSVWVVVFLSQTGREGGREGEKGEGMDGDKRRGQRKERRKEIRLLHARCME